MIKFHKISQIEHGEYPFEDAVVDEEIPNGAFGNVSGGKFTFDVNGRKAIMQIENGDDEHMDMYMIPAGSHVRVLDLDKVDGKLEIYGYPLDGDLNVGQTSGCIKITEIIGNKVGAVVEVIPKQN